VPMSGTFGGAEDKAVDWISNALGAPRVSGPDLSRCTDPPGETKGQTEEGEQPSDRGAEQFGESDKASHHDLGAGIHWGRIDWLRRAERGTFFDAGARGRLHEGVRP